MTKETDLEKHYKAGGCCIEEGGGTCFEEGWDAGLKELFRIIEEKYWDFGFPNEESFSVW